MNIMAEIKQPLIAQYSKFKDLNQRMKLTSGLYILSPDGRILTTRLGLQVERVGILNDLDSISAYLGCGFLPNTTFEFTKKAKKTKLEVLEKADAAYLSMLESDEPPLKLNQTYGDEFLGRHSDDLLKDPEYRTRDQQIVESMGYKYYNDIVVCMMDTSNDKFTQLPQPLIDKLLSPDKISITLNEVQIDMTLQIFPDFKKGDELYIKVLRECPGYSDNIKHVLFKTVNPIYTMFTLGAYLKIASD